MTAAVASLLAAVEIGWPLERGSLALFPLYHERPPSGAYLSGPRAAGHVQLGERPDGAIVPEMHVVNAAAKSVLLLDGETLLGGKQNRILTTSVLVAPGATAEVSVTCVEAGRWDAERPVGFSPRHAPSGVRARNRAHVTRSVVEGGCLQPDQSGVWEEVDRYATSLGAASATRAMEDVHAHAADRVRRLVGGTAPLPGQRGVAAAIGDRVIAIDLFDDEQTLADYWQALVAGYALDAEERPTAHPRRRDVRRVLAEVAAAAGTERDGRVHLEGRGLTATALVHDGVVIHVAASPTERPPSRGWFSARP
jgi:hypothetical protein